MIGELDDINCFISYHRPDNSEYLKVVERLRQEVSGRFEASTGRVLNIFLDRDSIGWGENWREKIFDSILTTTFFIPIVTMRFFRSEMCMEELGAYHESAKQLGVTELLLPIVLAGSSQISSTHVNPDVRLIESLNYISIEAAWEAGYESPEWRAIVNKMVRELTDALARTETVLVERENAEPESPPEGDAPVAEGDMEELTTSLTETSSHMTATTAAMSELGDAIKTSTAEIGAAPKESKKAVELRGARDISKLSGRFASDAETFEKSAVKTDAQLRTIVRELKDIRSAASTQQLETLSRAFIDYPDLGEYVAMVDEALGGLRLAAMTSLSMRKALEPAMRALQSMKVGFSAARSWPGLFSTPE
jgi:TIR domain